VIFWRRTKPFLKKKQMRLQQGKKRFEPDSTRGTPRGVSCHITTDGGFLWGNMPRAGRVKQEGRGAMRARNAGGRNGKMSGTISCRTSEEVFDRGIPAIHSERQLNG